MFVHPQLQPPRSRARSASTARTSACVNCKRSSKHRRGCVSSTFFSDMLTRVRSTANLSIGNKNRTPHTTSQASSADTSPKCLCVRPYLPSTLLTLTRNPSFLTPCITPCGTPYVRVLVLGSGVPCCSLTRSEEPKSRHRHRDVQAPHPRNAAREPVPPALRA